MVKNTKHGIPLALLTLALAILASNMATRPISSSQPTLEGIQIPGGDLIESNFPEVTLGGGTGYIFSSQQITSDDRDGWWNGVELVPDTDDRIVSLGLIGSLANVNILNFAGSTNSALEAVVGEGYGMEINRAGEIKYAIIKVVNIDGNNKITFELVYPFSGTVSLNP